MEFYLSEIASAAGVHRVSFYRNYREKEDVLREHMHAAYERWGRYHPEPEDQDGTNRSGGFSRIWRTTEHFFVFSSGGSCCICSRRCCWPTPVPGRNFRTSSPTLRHLWRMAFTDGLRSGSNGECRSPQRKSRSC